jgi:hypothetical protein
MATGRGSVTTFPDPQPEVDDSDLSSSHPPQGGSSGMVQAHFHLRHRERRGGASRVNHNATGLVVPLPIQG